MNVPSTRGAARHLGRCELFQSLTPVQVARLGRHAVHLSFKRRSIIYASDDPGRGVFLLTSGRVKLKNLEENGKEAILAFVDEREIFGELALVEPRRRGEFAEAVKDTRLLDIPREELLGLMEQRPEFAFAVTRLIGRRRRRVENRLFNVLTLPSPERLVRLLRELIDSHGTWDGDICTIDLPLSHQDLASFIGITRETVTHALGRLVAKNLIEIRHKRIIVSDYCRLFKDRPAPRKAPSDLSPEETDEA